MPICLAALDVACLASRFGEGFPNVIAEAMACGVPCVVTDVGDSREIVDGYGVVVPPGDAGALASGLHRLRERLIKSRPEIAISARQSIIDRFGAEVATERTERELTAILN